MHQPGSFNGCLRSGASPARQWPGLQVAWDTAHEAAGRDTPERRPVGLAALGRALAGAGDRARAPFTRVLLIAACGFAVSYLLRALRIHDEFRADASGRYPACLRIVLVHNAMINVVPFRGGEAAFPFVAAANLRHAAGAGGGIAVLASPPGRLRGDGPGGHRVAWTSCVAAGACSAGGHCLRLVVARWASRPHDWQQGGTLTSKLARVRDAFAETTRHAPASAGYGPSPTGRSSCWCRPTSFRRRCLRC